MDRFLGGSSAPGQPRDAPPRVEWAEPARPAMAPAVRTVGGQQSRNEHEHVSSFAEKKAVQLTVAWPGPNEHVRISDLGSSAMQSALQELVASRASAQHQVERVDRGLRRLSGVMARVGAFPSARDKQRQAQSER